MPEIPQISDSELTSDSEADIPLINFAHYTGKDGTTKWRKRPTPKKRTKLHNIVTQKQGPRGSALQVETPFEAWNCFITDEILDLIVNYTNIYIDGIKQKYSRARDVRCTNKTEIKALFGLLYYAGVLKSGKLNTRDLWATDGTGIDLFIATMSRKRFLLLLNCLRFDDIQNRSARRQTDKLAPIRQISDLFKIQLLNNYSVGTNVTIDEKLEPFRGRCSFRQYIKSKPAKYGIKIFLLTDSKTYYTSHFEIYCGQQADGPYKVENNPSSIVKRLILPIDKTGRNITMDNWFVSVPLVRDLLDNHKLTCVGTIRKNKREIPLEFVNFKV